MDTPALAARLADTLGSAKGLTRVRVSAGEDPSKLVAQ